MDVLVDSNVILDVITRDPHLDAASSAALKDLTDDGHSLIINPIIYAEVSVGFFRVEEVEEALPPTGFRRDGIPWEAGFLAGKSFEAYRKRGGSKRSPLPDFYIGAHASVRGMALMSRDKERYASYFPDVELIVP